MKSDPSPLRSLAISSCIFFKLKSLWIHKGFVILSIVQFSRYLFISCSLFSGDKRLIYYITSFEICQPLFWSFLNFFLMRCCHFSAATFILYHTFFRLSSTFFHLLHQFPFSRSIDCEFLAFYTRLSLRKLIYYIMISPFCQRVFPGSAFYIKYYLFYHIFNIYFLFFFL